MLSLIRGLAGEYSLTVLFTSHIFDEVARLCDRVGILVLGRLVIKGRMDELLTRRIERIEVIAKGLAPGGLREPDLAASFARRSEDGDHFVVADMDTANRLVRAIHARGGTLFAFLPVRESLEDYFVHHQETGHEDPRRRP